MSPVTHFLVGWMVANTGGLNRRDRAAISLAGVIPDIDGLGAIPEVLTRNSSHPLTWFSDYHRTFHNLTFAVVVASISFALATRRWKTAALAFLSFHLHLLGDLIGARGPEGHQWPIPYFLHAFLKRLGMDLGRPMGAECLAELPDYLCSAFSDVLLGLAARLFALGNVFFPGRWRFCESPSRSLCAPRDRSAIVRQ